MIKIRLDRRGVRNKPFYRIIAIEESSKKGGVPLEILGFWNPIKETAKIDKRALEGWTNKGAQITQGVKRLLEPQT